MVVVLFIDQHICVVRPDVLRRTVRDGRCDLQQMDVSVLLVQRTHAGSVRDEAVDSMNTITKVMLTIVILIMGVVMVYHETQEILCDYQHCPETCNSNYTVVINVYHHQNLTESKIVSCECLSGI